MTCLLVVEAVVIGRVRVGVSTSFRFIMVVVRTVIWAMVIWAMVIWAMVISALRVAWEGSILLGRCIVCGICAMIFWCGFLVEWSGIGA